MNLTDKLVVITGAGSGIGRATARAFAAAGARIAHCDVDRARVDALASELGASSVLAQRVDVADRAQMADFAAAVHALAPAADVVVNNAGVAIGGSFLETSLDDWDWLLGINLRGVVHGCHFFARPMVERGAGGHIVNISSILGIYPAPSVSAYVASKFAVLGLSRSLRAELGEHRIGVTAICPGMINTAIVDDGRITGALGGRKAKVSAAFKKGAPPERVAEAVVDAVHTNPAVRTVGRDAWAIHTLTRVAPRVVDLLGTTLSRRFGAAD
jgi:NADP-dependent 3-hydroxy acid dehydrogenase YdfG